jgi:hypothetical protein
MQPFTSIASRYVQQVFGKHQPSTARKNQRRRPQRRVRRFESLEDRSVLSATFGSAIALGGPEGERVFDLKLDGAGNTYVTGYYMGTADFDQGRVHLGDADILTSKGGTDAFVAKYAPDNSLLWVRSLGGDVPPPEFATIITEAGRSLAVDQYGNVFVTGEFWGRGTFGNTELVSVGSGDGFLTKLTPDGTIAWAKSWGVVGNEAARGVDVDAQGNAYVINNTFDVNSHSIQKFSATGQSLWKKSIAQPGDVAVTPSGSIYISGSFTGKVDFDPGPKAKNVTAGTNSAAFVLNLDTSGNFRWVTPFIGSGTAYATAVEVDATGNVYAAGSYSGSVDFDPSGRVSTLGFGSGEFITKLSSSGSLVWARGLTSGPIGNIYGLAIDTTGNVYATGGFWSSIDLDPGAGSVIRTTSGGESDGDIFVVKFSSSGNYVWGETFGGTGLDIGYGLAVDGAGGVVLGGTFGDVVDFDPSLSEYMLTAAGQREGFILRLNQS